MKNEKLIETLESLADKAKGLGKEADEFDKAGEYGRAHSLKCEAIGMWRAINTLWKAIRDNKE